MLLALAVTSGRAYARAAARRYQVPMDATRRSARQSARHGRAFDRPPDDDNVIAVFTQTESLTAVGTVPLLILFARDRSRCHSECEMQKERASGVSTAEHASGGVRYRSASLRRVARHSATATGACLLPPVAALLQDRSHSESDSLLTAPSSSCRPTRARRQTGTAESR